MRSSAPCRRSCAEVDESPGRRSDAVRGGQAGRGRRSARKSSPCSARTRARNLHVASRVDCAAMIRRLARCCALLDGRYITEARTAAVSAVSSRLLARKTAAVAGDHRVRRAGAQPPRSAGARAPLSQVTVWSPNKAAPGRVRRLAAKMPFGRSGTGRPPRSTAVDHAGEAVVGRGHHRPGHLVADAGPREWLGQAGRARDLGRRLPAESARDGSRPRRARAGCSSTRAPPRSSNRATSSWACRKGASAPTTSSPSSARLANGAAGRRNDAEVTIFKSLGMAVEDVTAAELAYRRAVERGIGQEIDAVST